MGVGLALGTAAVGYRAGLSELVVMGAITGVGLGAAQALVLRHWLWAVAMPLL